MKRTQKSILFLLAAGMLFTGCAKPSNAAPVPTVFADTIFAPREEATPETRHVSQVLSDTLSIEADVVLPEKTEYSTYTLKMVDCDPDRLLGILCPDGVGTLQKEERGWDKIYRAPDGKLLVVGNRYMTYRSYNWGDGTPMQEIWKMMELYAQDYREPKQQDLSFMSFEQIRKMGEQLLRDLGIAFDPKLEYCAAFTNQEIQAYQKEYFPHSTKDLTGSSDSCFLEFSFSCDGLPIISCREPTVSLQGSVRPSPQAVARMAIDENGIRDLELFYPCAYKSVARAEPILSLDEAIVALKEEEKENPNAAAITVSKIWLEYIPVARKDSVVLTPYWCFLSIDPIAEKLPGDWENAERINAFTGLAYGG